MPREVGQSGRAALCSQAPQQQMQCRLRRARPDVVAGAREQRPVAVDPARRARRRSQTVPTGFAALPPPGPAIPVTATASVGTQPRGRARGHGHGHRLAHRAVPLDERGVHAEQRRS